jgi:hypothetical protein
VACKNAARWVYRLARSHSWQSPFSFDREWAFQDKKGRTRLVISAEGVITVTRGYSWDGCTPKFCVFDILVGTPDGVVYSRTGHPKAYFASLVHDALYQFLPDGLPLTRAQADECFLKLLTESEFAPRHLYYLAVRLFGWLTLPITRRVRGTSGGHPVDLTDLAGGNVGGAPAPGRPGEVAGHENE